MSFEHDPVKPTPFEAAEPKPPVTAQSPLTETDTGNRVIFAALLGLLILVAIVVLWLPGQMEHDAASSDSSLNAPSSKSPADAAPAPAPTPSRPADQSATSAAPPFAEAREARLRQNTQDVLSPMLDAQFELREQGVEHWAAESFKAAGEMAVEGDLLYRDRQFEAAQAKYQAALDALRALQQTVPAVLADYLEQTRIAIEEGDAASGAEQLAIASLIAPQDTRLTHLEQRLAQVPAIVELSRQSQQAESNGDLDNAITALEQALQLDKEHLRVKTDLNRVSAALRAQNFSQAMSNGYAALSEQRFKRAREMFRQAGRFLTGSPEAASALREVDERETAYRLQQLALQGETAQKGEEWQKAVSVYEQALALDSTVLFATQGLALSRPRAKLAAQLQTLLNEPKRLEDKKVADTARELLAQGRPLGSTSPVLQAQLQALEALLVKATTPVTIVLRSDEQTEVIVHKVARLGRFDRHSLALRPGTYTAVGSRRGYRDVRREFSVSHAATTSEITIACTEPI